MRLWLTLLFCFAFPSVNAATQGDAAPVSNGDLEITVTLGLLSRISGLSDIAFGSWSGGDLNTSQNICVGLYGTSNYRVRAEGSGDNHSSNAFALSNGSAFLPYQVYFNDQTGVNGRTALIAAKALTAQSVPGGAFWNLFGCLTRNANLSVEVLDSQLRSVPSGHYTGTLTVTLIPE